MQVNAYTVSLFVSAAVSAALAVYAWRKREVSSGIELALLMLAIALWALFQGLEGLVTSRIGKMSWGAASYIGSQATPVLFFLFAMRYAQLDRWLNRWKIALLWVIPAISVTLAFTGGVQHVLWKNVALVTKSTVGVTAVFSHGPWYWVAVAYGYALMLLGIIALARIFARPQLYSWQARLLLLAALIPLVAHVLYSFAPSKVEGLDLTPVAFTLSGVLVVLAVYRYRFLDLRPVASSVIYDGIGDAMVAIDTGGRVVDVNPAAQDFLGVKADDVIGRPAVEVLTPIPGLPDRLQGEEAEAEASIRIDTESGKEHYDARIWPLRDRGRHLLGRLVTIRDVTEMTRAEEELKRINAELDGYAHTVSHDLKNPLTAIGLACELLESSAIEQDAGCRQTIEQTVEVIRKNIDKASDLISELLVLARAGQEPIEVSSVPVRGVVDSILLERMADLDERGFRIEVDEDLGRVVANPTHLYQVFSNLIGNSIRYCDNPEPLIVIRSRECDEPGAHRYLFRDNGPGIPDDILPRAFEAFVKGRPGGSGIGLSIVQRIVEVYGGSIRAYNDGGACFEFTLRDFESE